MSAPMMKTNMPWDPKWETEAVVAVEAQYLKQMWHRQFILDRLVVFGGKMADPEAKPEEREAAAAKYEQAMADAVALDKPGQPKFPDDETLVATAKVAELSTLVDSNKEAIADLSMMIRRLANKLHRVDSLDPIVHQAFDLVERKGSKPQILRGE